ncbi:MAG TPA: hypothetical protein DHV48_03535 [Prolixibacteraceae bacterium]|nr:hypothetical protein [Prolixibacteraceae bacterium]
MKSYSLQEIIEKEFGAIGTPERDQFESDLEKEVLKMIERKSESSDLILNGEIRESCKICDNCKQPLDVIRRFDIPQCRACGKPL